MTDDPQRERYLQILTDRQRAYRMAFAPNPATKAVMDDLASFSRATETCLVPGDRDRTYALLGRNEVWLRIRDHLDLTPEELLVRYTRPAD